MEEFLREVDRPEWTKWLERTPTGIAADWTGPARRELLPQWVAYVCAGSPKIVRALGVLERLGPASAVVTNKVRRLLEEIPRLHEASDLAATLKELTQLAMVKDIKKADKPDAVTYEALKEAFTALRGVAETLRSFRGRDRRR